MNDQEKWEKVIKGLECCMSGQPDGLGCSRVPCPYNQFEDCEGILHRDALALLKAQEPVEPTWRLGVPFCSKCGRQFKRGYKYCPDCGVAVKWE